MMERDSKANLDSIRSNVDYLRRRLRTDGSARRGGLMAIAGHTYIPRTPSEIREEREERAAIIEHLAEVPRDVAERAADELLGLVPRADLFGETRTEQPRKAERSRKR